MILSYHNSAYATTAAHYYEIGLFSEDTFYASIDTPSLTVIIRYLYALTHRYNFHAIFVKPMFT